MAYINPNNPVFISYSWADKNNPGIEQDVDLICKLMEDNNILYLRDKGEGDNKLIDYRGNIYNSEEMIGKANAIVMFFGAKYMRSLHCLHELHAVLEYGNYAERIFPIILEDMPALNNTLLDELYSSAQLIRRKFMRGERLDQYEMDFANSDGYQSDITKLADHLKMHNIPSIAFMREREFAPLIEQLQKFMGEAKPKTENAVPKTEVEEPEDEPEEVSKLSKRLSGQGNAKAQICQYVLNDFDKLRVIPEDVIQLIKEIAKDGIVTPNELARLEKEIINRGLEEDAVRTTLDYEVEKARERNVSKRKMLIAAIAILLVAALTLLFTQLPKGENNSVAETDNSNDLQKAIEYYDNDNYKSAFPIFKRLSEQGNAEAQNYLGACYYLGQGVMQSYSEAVNWYRKAAEQGNADAQSSLGACYYYGQGVMQSYTEAVNWYRKAAEQGYAEAQNSLGSFYLFGQGVTQSYTEAVNWFRKAAEQGNVYAQANLGNCYCYGGQGVTQSYTEAVNWYRKAAEQGNAIAQKKLGLCYENGNGVPQSQTEAIRWYKMAARQGDEDAIQYLRDFGVYNYD